MGAWESYRAGTWLIDECHIVFFHELSYVKKSGPTFFVIIFFVICVTVNNMSGILDTTDTSFMHYAALCTAILHFKFGTFLYMSILFFIDVNIFCCATNFIRFLCVIWIQRIIKMQSRSQYLKNNRREIQTSLVGLI